MTKLYEAPRKSVIAVDGISDGSRWLLFHHLDGMYSYCTTEKGEVAHLSAVTPLVKSNKTIDGVKIDYEIESNSETE